MWEDVLPVRNNYQVALMSSNLVMLSLVLSPPTFILSAWSAGMSVADMLLLAKYSWTVDSGIKHYPSINTHFVGCGDNQAGRLRQEPKPWDRHYCQAHTAGYFTGPHNFYLTTLSEQFPKHQYKH